MLTSMEWLYSVKMELNDAYIQGYLPILWTTPKSEFFLFFFGFHSESFTYLIGPYLPRFKTKAFVHAHVVSYPNQSLINSDLYLIARIALTKPASMIQVVLTRPGKPFTS
jgi:hypothetical protein